MKYALTLLLVLSRCANAASEAVKDLIQTNNPAVTGSVSQVVFGLFLVLVIIFVSAFLLKRFNQFSGNPEGNMKVLAGLSLGMKERLVLVEVGQTQILIGLAPGNVQAVHVFPEPVVDSSELKSNPGFLAQLQKAVRKGD